MIVDDVAKHNNIAENQRRYPFFCNQKCPKLLENLGLNESGFEPSKQGAVFWGSTRWTNTKYMNMYAGQEYEMGSTLEQTEAGIWLNQEDRNPAKKVCKQWFLECTTIEITYASFLFFIHHPLSFLFCSFFLATSIGWNNYRKFLRGKTHIH
jgi:hypothetical protein